MYIVTTVYHILSFAYFQVAKNLIVFWLSYGIATIRNHINPEDKRKQSELGLKSKRNETDPLKSKQNELFWLKKASGSRGVQNGTPNK